MDIYTQLFWLFAIVFVVLSAYLMFMCKKKSNTFYIQVASGLGMFATSKIGRKFLGLEQMNCTVSTIAGIGLLGAAVYTSLVPKEDVNRLRDIVSGDAALAYEKISKERATLYVVGIGIGLIVAFLAMNAFGSKISNRFHRMTTFVAITLFTGVTFYTVYPKSDYMLNHIKNDKEAKAWMEVYKTMKMRYIIGFVMGSLAAIPLANAFC